MQQTWGIIGVGQLGTSLVEGLLHSPSPPSLHLSPRGGPAVRALTARFPVEIGTDNQAVVDSAEHVVLAVRPNQLLDLAAGLRFRASQVVVSVAAAVRLEAIANATGPARVVRAMPVLSASMGDSPTCVYPPEPAASELFERLGPVHPFDDEQTFEAASVAAMYYAWVHALMDVPATWLEANGVAAQTSRTLIAEMTRAAARRCLADGRNMGAMAAEIARPGTFSALGMQLLHDRGALDAWADACRSVLGECRRRGRL